MTDQASFRLQVVDAIPLIIVSGEVDLSNVTQFKKFAADAALGESNALVVSLTRVSYLDSHMVAALADLSKRLETNRKCLVLAAEKGSPAAHILSLNGIDRAIRVFDSDAEAIEAVR